MSPRPGPRREPINARVLPAARDALQKRADIESEGNLSEFARRCLSYALTHMPKGWTPERETS